MVLRHARLASADDFYNARARAFLNYLPLPPNRDASLRISFLFINVLVARKQFYSIAEKILTALQNLSVMSTRFSSTTTIVQ